MTAAMRGMRRVMAAAPAALLAAGRAARCDQGEKPERSNTKQQEKRTFEETLMSPCPPWKREWVVDWDGRHPEAGSKVKCQGKVRHILLIRHGQYDLEDRDHGLTPLGFEQARLTGKRLAATTAGVKKDAYGEVKIEYNMLASSNVLRAQQTAEVIAQELPNVYRAPPDPLLAEGWPVLPWPQGPDFLRDGSVFPASILEEGPRIEAGFRKYVRRDADHKRQSAKEEKLKLSEGYAPANQPVISPEAASLAKKEHEYIILVCHMNVIRYFVCRALQLPPETWLRMRGNNCGITEIIIQPSGQVSLGSFADVGHLAIEQVTFH